MSAIERCRTAALGGHVARCENAACGHTEVAYNSCRNRHCPKCQGAASRRWLADREAELLPVPCFHVVYTLPSELRDIAYQNKRVIYDLLMKAAAETTLAIASDPVRTFQRWAERFEAEGDDGLPVNELIAWMKQQRAKLSRHNDVAKAFDYMLKRIDAFTCFLADGRICISNNAAERALRGIALGRKAWLFASMTAAAKAPRS